MKPLDPQGLQGTPLYTLLSQAVRPLLGRLACASSRLCALQQPGWPAAAYRVSPPRIEVVP